MLGLLLMVGHASHVGGEDVSKGRHDSVQLEIGGRGAGTASADAATAAAASFGCTTTGTSPTTTTSSFFALSTAATAHWLVAHDDALGQVANLDQILASGIADVVRRNDVQHLHDALNCLVVLLDLASPLLVGDGMLLDGLWVL